MIDFYYFPPSPPCRSVMLLAKMIGVHLNPKTVNVLQGDQMKPEYIKMNPQHVIPTIDDAGFILCESRPIMGYLVSKYAKNDSLYPRDPKKKGIVDQRLYFDLGTLYERTLNCYAPIIFGMRNNIKEEDVEAVEKAFEILDKILDDGNFVAGENLTIADVSIATTVTLAMNGFGFDVGRYDNVYAWYGRCTDELNKYGFDDIHEPGNTMFRSMLESNLRPDQ